MRLTYLYLLARTTMVEDETRQAVRLCGCLHVDHAGVLHGLSFVVRLESRVWRTYLPRILAGPHAPWVCGVRFHFTSRWNLCSTVHLCIAVRFLHRVALWCQAKPPSSHLAATSRISTCQNPHTTCQTAMAQPRTGTEFLSFSLVFAANVIVVRLPHCAVEVPRAKHPYFKFSFRFLFVEMMVPWVVETQASCCSPWILERSRQIIKSCMTSNLNASRLETAICKHLTSDVALSASFAGWHSGRSS